MNNRSFWFALGGVFSGLIIGFLLANNFSRAEIENRRLTAKAEPSVSSANSPAKIPSVQTEGEEPSLSPEELRQAIVKADANPQDNQLQRNLGIALYRYAGLEQNADLLIDSVRLLERAEPRIKDNDAEFFGVLGNAHFLLARRGEPARMKQARSAYQKILKSDPKNVDVAVDVGLTYFYGQPTDYPQALQYYSQALLVNPSHERGYENSIIALIALQRRDEAVQNLEKLKKVNPSNAAIADLEVQLAQLEITDK